MGEGTIPEDGDGVAGPVMERVRGSDRVKNAVWEGVEKVYQFTDGWYMGRVFTPTDCDTLGVLMGHCAGGHYGWVLQNLTYFFSVFGPDDVPHTTMHAKRTSQMFRTMQPNEGDLINKWEREREISSHRDGHVASSTYDNGALRRDYGEPRDAAYYDGEAAFFQSQADQNQENYEAMKKQALKYGPINHDNPYKGDMDYFNREKVKYLQKAKEQKANADELRDKPEPKAIRGRRVLFQKRDITIISNAVKGSFQGDEGKHDARTREWLDSLPQRDNAPINHPRTGRFQKMTLNELREARNACYR